MDKYGNPIQHHTDGGAPTDAGYGADTDGGFDATTGAVRHDGTTGYAGTDGGQQQQRRPDPKDNNNPPGTLNRSGSSSSSEDDEQGGRRKKGLKQKIKEKLPGGHMTEEEQYRNQVAAETTGTGNNTAAHGYGQGGAVREPEKKGMMEKVREQIPGGNKTAGNKSDEERRHQVSTGTTGTGTNTAAHGYGQGVAVHEPEKKGLMEKVKENIPCGNKTEEHGHPVATGTGTGTNTGAQGIGQGGAVHEPEKKGLMEKVKENIPCGNKTEEHGHPVATGTGTGTNTGAQGIGQGGAVHEPGMMQKIKEKLAGQH